MNLAEIEEVLSNKKEHSLKVDLAALHLTNIYESLELRFIEPKIIFVHEIIEIIKEQVKDTDESKKLFKELHDNISIFISREELGLNTANRDYYEKRTIYKITGEVDETLHLAHNEETDKLTYLSFDAKVHKIKTYKKLKKEFTKRIHKNNLGKRMHFVKEVK